MSHEQTAIELIATERQRQVDVEGWTPEHDDRHDYGELACAAMSYACPNGISTSWRDDINSTCPPWWPWHPGCWKPTHDDRIRELSKAGALIAAEIERLLRAGDAA